MINQPLQKEKYSSFTTSSCKSNKTFKILWIIALITSIILFVVGSIWDLPIAKALGNLNDNGFISWLSMFWDKLAYTMTVPFIFGIAGIVMETLNKKYGKQQSKGPIIISTIYIVFIVAYVILFAFVTKGMADLDVGLGAGRDYWFGLERVHVIVVMSLEIGIEVVMMICVVLYMRLRFSKREDLLTRNYWIDGIKAVAVFGIVQGSLDPTLKTFWGRPYFVHVDFQNVLEQLPSDWDISSFNDSSNAEYLEWWEINGFNSEYWKAMFSGEYGDTHWDDVAFPSGHMSSASMIGYTFLLLFMNEKRGQTITWWKWLIFSIFVFNVGVMGVMQIISRTHYLTDLMFTTTFLLLLFKPINYLVDHVTYFVLSLIWKKQSTKQEVDYFENKNTTIICIKIDDIYWTVAKIRTSRIDKSNKYKRWSKIIS
ncbi:phosphatase PAP2 family protein [Spiroplasma endosymbiont of Othius punctulatus]|uniref:phosphatase PAP2 family protein n=1 Tax=Spiroplasma endosymbiont of Othius punctulatus TaxID=3066289 RepID=UPI0030CF0467